MTRRARTAALAAAVTLTLCALAGAWRLRAGDGAAVRWASPWMLPLAGVALAFAAARARDLPRTMAPWRRRWFFGAGAASALLLALAAAGPEWGHEADRLTVVFAVDRSRSTDLAGGAARAASMERAAMVRMRTFDRLARVAFAAEAVTEDVAHDRDTPPSPARADLARDGTDVAAGLRRALAELPAGSAGRVVLVTDGAANRGDALAAAAAARAQGVPVDVVPLRRAVRRNVRVEAVRAPQLADEHAAFDLRVVTRSDVEADVDVRVSVDGELAHRGRARVAPGEAVLTLRQTAPAPGLHRYEVELVPRDPSADEVSEDDRGGAFLRVRGAPSVLVLEGDPGASAPLARALREGGGLRVVERGQNGFPQDLAELAGYDLVALSDVPARALAPEQMEQLRTYVRDLGGGLLLLGGDRSFGPGGYSRTPVEEVSPVSFDLRQERRRASLSEVISIDYSGSMTAQVGPYTKIQLANEAAARSAMLLGPGDRLGVAHVDTATRWTVRLGHVADLDAVVSRVRAVAAGGGGIIVPTALRDGYAALHAEGTNLKHLLLFADGDDAEEMQGCAETAAEAFREGITTSVVSLGRGVDTAELERLAGVGHGRFYLVEDAMRLPTVFAQETILASRASIREERFRAAPRAPDVVTAGVDFATAPPLRGYVVTVPKPRASVLLAGPDDDPLLATWQVGVGRVAAFTSDLKDRWGADWLPWAGAAQLEIALARSLVRRDDGLVRAEADASGGALRVRATAADREGRADPLRRLTARVTAPDGTAREVPLDPAGGGSYVAERPLRLQGAYVVTVRDDALGAVVATAGAMLTAGEEFRPPSDPALLERVAAMTGGRVLASADRVFDDRVGRRLAWTPLAPYLLALGLLALLTSLLARRLALPDAVARRLGRLAPSPDAPPTPARAPSPTLAAALDRRARRPAPVAAPAPAATPGPRRDAQAPARDAPDAPATLAARMLARRPAEPDATSPRPRAAPTRAPARGRAPAPDAAHAEAKRGPAVRELAARRRARDGA